MEYPEKEKRKNDERPRMQWWLLAIGFVLGVAVMLVVTQAGAPQTSAAINQVAPDDIAQTATAIILMATGQAEAMFDLATPISELDPLFVTATHIIEMATQQAAQASP